MKELAKSRLIYVEGSSYADILKTIKNYKIYVEEIKDSYILMDN